MNDKTESDMQRSERKAFQAEGTSLLGHGTERLV